MNAGREGDWFRRKFEQRLLKRLRRIGNANLRGIDRFGEIERNKDCRCAGFAQQTNVFSICEEANFSQRCFAERCSAGDLQHRVAE